MKLASGWEIDDVTGAQTASTNRAVKTVHRDKIIAYVCSAWIFTQVYKCTSDYIVNMSVRRAKNVRETSTVQCACRPRLVTCKVELQQTISEISSRQSYTDYRCKDCIPSYDWESTIIGDAWRANIGLYDWISLNQTKHSRTLLSRPVSTQWLDYHLPWQVIWQNLIGLASCRKECLRTVQCS